MPSSNLQEKGPPQIDGVDESPSLKLSGCRKFSPKSPYEEIQEDELIALAAIYGDDFKRIASSCGAWNKSEPRFEIRIKSSDENTAVTLLVSLTASYPKTPPLLSLKDETRLKDSTRATLLRIIDTKPLELVVEEQAMIMEIVSACYDVLEEAAKVNATDRNIPSLEMERTALQVAAIKKAQVEKERDEKKRHQEALEKERIQETLVKDEISRQKAKAKEMRRKNRPPVSDSDAAIIKDNINEENHDEILSFEQSIRILDADRNPVSFQKVTNKILIRQGPSSSCFTVRPVMCRKSCGIPTLVLKETILATETQSNTYKLRLQSLEFDLRLLKSISHQNILQFFDFRVYKSSEQMGEMGPRWSISILTEFAEKGSLQEFIDIAGSISVERVRSWTIELLDALQFLHEKGIVHGDLHTGNILLVRSIGGEVRPKLADALYQIKIHGLVGQKQSLNDISIAKSPYWTPPEVFNTKKPNYSQKTDIWYFGILFLQMIFGLAITKNYSSPVVLVDSINLSASLSDFILKMFKADFKKRPRAVELSPSEFLATDALIYEETSKVSMGSKPYTLSLPMSQARIRSDSASIYPPRRSRYREDFVEVGRLGKGGFGEVVKARKRLDGQLYAIKKIVQKSSTSLDEVLKEVRLLSQLSHPSVVRYYNTWTEEVSDGFETDEITTENDSTAIFNSSENSEAINSTSIECCDNTVGLDFMSSSNYPQIEFGYDDVTDEEGHYSSDSEKSNDNKVIVKNNDLDLARSGSEKFPNRVKKTVLYISMEYCEKQTLRDLIKRGLHEDEDEIWRLFREILEGLGHIHSQNIVHRDLKPENIFIDAASNVKIGDFGLAINGQYPMNDKLQDVTLHNVDMTRNIGTAFYVAPEVKSSSGGNYSSKVDMYSLGIIFFEMCSRPLIPGMDRATVGNGLRNIKPIFPAEFRVSERQTQVDIITALLSHDLDKRPSSLELLKSGKLPLQMENETIQQTFTKLTDPNSPYFNQITKNLFSLPNDMAKDHAWEVPDFNSSSVDSLLTCSMIRQRLVEIFRHHGAIETTRSMLFPRSSHYGSNSMQLLERNGSILQLPYDLTLPYARVIAKYPPFFERSFVFGQVFRDRETGGQPETFGEVDFDIVSTDSLDFTFKEAEVIKVLDEIVGSFPSLTASKMCFHLNHSEILGYVFDYCRIDPKMRNAVANTLSKLNIQSWNWQNIQLELRSPLIGLSAPSIDDLQRFNFRDTPNLAFQKLKTLFEGTNNYEKASLAIAHLQEVLVYTKRLEVKNIIYITPLWSLNEKFYKGGLLFSCNFDRKIKDVFAAGGRYDSLIQEFKNKANDRNSARCAVGFNLAWEKIARRSNVRLKNSYKKMEGEDLDSWKTKRCDVLVASHDATILRTTGITLLQMLWSYSISAELARDSHSPEDLLSKYRDDQHSWIVVVKQDSVLKIKSMVRKDAKDIDISPDQLVSFLKTEMREMDRKLGTHQREKLQQTSNIGEVDYEQDVMVLIAGTKTKKSNRRNIVEQAHACAVSLTHEMLRGPIAAIETTDQVMEYIKGTRLSEPETWRSLSQIVPMAERRYLGEVQSMLLKIKEQNVNVTRFAFIYNFRSGKCIYYDLGA
ncbi:eIF-2-alpha kinase GCN2 [Erysiphe neolycopersici]|uniref:non-specific serine/threonine protein kinase n=1 Tax=Erysiphe neolycopersici TaxID=212602 RepID=A0A420I2W4_9PEZI|nr:eIF-2-alpha kinase GCN2 [Erysiphe neolycopersici]